MDLFERDNLYVFMCCPKASSIYVIKHPGSPSSGKVWPCFWRVDNIKNENAFANQNFTTVKVGLPSIKVCMSAMKFSVRHQIKNVYIWLMSSRLVFPLCNIGMCEHVLTVAMGVWQTRFNMWRRNSNQNTLLSDYDDLTFLENVNVWICVFFVPYKIENKETKIFSR